MDCTEVFASRHALRRLFQRGISMSEAVRVIREGDVVEEYPDDEPWPETVLLGETSHGPIHVVVGRDSETGRCVMITVYWPDHHRWDDEFRRRRS